ncbi:MAG: hypothetical protein LBK76_03180, partial [Verrucomicrobiales bacterium]|nr:hypothetical protein [Verrucomicrobiales bacterium]
AAFARVVERDGVNAAALWLEKKHGVNVHPSNVARWLADWQQRDQRERILADVRAVAAQSAELLAAAGGDTDKASKTLLDQLAFDRLMAGRPADEVTDLVKIAAIYGESVSATERNRIAREKLKLSAGKLRIDERKLKLLEAKAAQADATKAVMTEVKLTPEERDRKIREILGL